MFQGLRLVAGVLLAFASFAAAASNVTGTMSVAGLFAGRGNVTYTITLTNVGAPQPDNLTSEFVIILPTTLALTGSSANAGATSMNVITRTVAWNGSLATGASVTIQVQASVNPVAPGTVVMAQGSILYDANEDGTNEATRPTDDLSVPGVDNPTSFTAVAGTSVSGTMVPTAGPFTGGARIGYTVQLTNAGPLALNDNPSNEFIVTLPNTLTLVSTTASFGDPFANTGNNSASWSGGLAVNGSVTVQIVADVNPNPPGTVISAQGTILFDRNGDNTNEATVMTDDPRTMAAIDATAFTLVPRSDVSGTMSVAGDFVVGGDVTYTVVLTNSGVADNNDNPSNEFITTLPNTLVLVSATSSSGTAFANTSNNSASFSGVIALGVPITVTIRAIVNLVPPGTPIAAQGTVLFDRNGDNTNEATRMTDDPATVTVGDATVFVVTLPEEVFADGFEG